jgi:hypothetical protein
VVEDEDDKGGFKQLLRRLPRKRLLLIALIVLVNAYVRCYTVWKQEYHFVHEPCTGGPLCPCCGIWTFTRDEWLRVVWPWK